MTIDRAAWWIQTVLTAVVIAAVLIWLVHYLIIWRQAKRHFRETGLDVHVFSRGRKVTLEISPATGSEPHPWTILTTRNGEDIAQPSSEQLEDAVDELFEGNEAADVEHRNALVRYGTDNGPMFVVEAYSNGLLIMSKYADADFGEPSHEVRLHNVLPDMVLEAWSWLSRGEFDKIRHAHPTCQW